MAAKPIWTTEQIVRELDSNEHWINHNTITYYIDGQHARSTILDSTGNISLGMHSMTSQQRSAAIAAFQAWDDLIPLTIQRSHDYDANISLNMTTNNGSSFQYTANFSPNGSQLPSRTTNIRSLGAANIWIQDIIGPPDAQQNYSTSTFKLGTHYYSTFVHEIGHSLGLHHPGEYNASIGDPSYDADAMFGQDTIQYSIMSYWLPSHFNPSVTYMLNGTLIEPSTPMLYDVAAIQSMYGFDSQTRSGNTTYGTGQPFAGSDAVYNFSVNTAPVLTIYDAGGNDTLDVSMYSQNQLVDLRPGYYSNIGALTQNVAMAFNTGKGANPNSIIENGIGGSGSDLMMGNDSDNKLEGRDGNDALNGGVGNDNLDGGFGADSMLGGVGDDTYFVNDVGDYISEMENLTDSGGNDTIRTNLTFYQLANDPRSQIENLTFVLPTSFTGIGNYLNNVITGNNGADFLQGNEGNDTLIGGGGIDSLIGGVGDDVYLVDRSSDIVVESENAGIDEVQSGSSTFVLGANVENLTYVGIDGKFRSFSGTGNALNNKIVGGAEGDTLIGGAGDDNLIGNYGQDILFGEDGNDTLKGGAGEDTINGGSGFDVVDYRDILTKAIIDLSAGKATFPQSQTAGTDILQNMEGVITGRGNDIVTGNSIDNTFYFTGQYSSLISTGGFDTFDGGSGSDTLAFSLFRGRVTVDLSEGRALAHYSVANGGGTRLLAEFKSIENVIASFGDDKITGDDKDNTFTYVGAFGDQVNRGGFDTYEGGKGSDTVDFSQFTGQISLDLNDGNVGASYHVTLPGGGEAAGAGIIARVSGIENVISSLADDTIVGDANDNTFTLTGSFTINADAGGNDTFNGGDGSDTLDLSRFVGFGQVDFEDGFFASSYGYQTEHGGGFEARTMVLLTSVENAVGSKMDDLIEGDSNNNIFAGAGGNDTLRGEGGDDRLTGGIGSDTFRFDPGFGHDVITDFAVKDKAGAVHDVIRFTGSIFADWDHLQAAISDGADGAVITVDADDTITLTGVTRQQLIDNHEADFLLA